MTSLLTTTAITSTALNSTGLAAQFKSIVPSDLFMALGLGFIIGIIIAIVYRKTYRGVLYSPSFTMTLIMLTLITTPVVMCIKTISRCPWVWWVRCPSSVSVPPSRILWIPPTCSGR